MFLPSWTLGALAWSTVGHVLQFAVCEASLAAEDNNPIVFISRLVVFTGCGELHPLVSLVFFIMFSLPLILIVATIVSTFTTSTAGVIVGLVTGAIAVVVGFFS